MDEPHSLSVEQIRAETLSPGVATADGPFIYSARAPKSARLYSASNEIEDEKRILKKVEALGASKEQIKQTIKSFLEDKDKGFFSRVLDKVKDFFSRFIPF